MSQTIGSIFSKNMKKLRVARNMTQDDLARALNLSRSGVANYESEKRQPDADMIGKIADYFDVSVDYMMGRTTKLMMHNRKEMSPIQQVEQELMKKETLDLSGMEICDKLKVAEFFRYLLATS